MKKVENIILLLILYEDFQVVSSQGFIFCNIGETEWKLCSTNDTCSLSKTELQALSQKKKKIGIDKQHN